jgi:GT2 family glycosyltransferase
MEYSNLSNFEKDGKLDISIIIVNWNAKNYLRDCLNSVFRQEYPGLSYEVFVVDNGSSDASTEMVKRQFPQVKIIANSQNYGFSAANNQAIKRSRGKYILLLNPDTVVLKGCMNRMTEFMDHHPEAGAAGCKILNTKGEVDNFGSARRFPTPLTKFFFDIHLDKLFPGSKLFGKYAISDWDRNEVREIDVLTGAFMFVRRKAIREAGLLDESFFLLAEDIDWCFRIKKKNWKILFNPDAQIIHHLGKSIDQVKLTRLKNAILGNLTYFQKHHNRWDCLTFRVLTSLTNLIKMKKWIFKLLFSKNRRLALENVKAYFLAVFLSFSLKTNWKEKNKWL